MGVFSKFKEKILGERDESFFDDSGSGEEYVEINTVANKQKAKVIVQPFVVNEFQDIKPALDALREGYTIALVNIKPLKDKDIV